MKLQHRYKQGISGSKDRALSLFALALAAGGLIFSAPAHAEQATTPQKYCEQLEAASGPNSCEILGYQIAPGWGGVGAPPYPPRIQKTAILVELCHAGAYRTKLVQAPQTEISSGGITEYVLGGAVTATCP